LARCKLDENRCGPATELHDGAIRHRHRGEEAVGECSSLPAKDRGCRPRRRVSRRAAAPFPRNS
jgi:hypothetical protein